MKKTIFVLILLLMISFSINIVQSMNEVTYELIKINNIDMQDKSVMITKGVKAITQFKFSEYEPYIILSSENKAVAICWISRPLAKNLIINIMKKVKLN
jgi:hypothetical protein